MSASGNHVKEEKNITLPDGHVIYTCTWKPTTTPKAHILFLHGFSDHSNAYYDFFPSLSSSHLQILSFDQRGWGKSCPSPSHRGRTGNTKDIFADMDFLLRPLLDSKLPVFLIGHSMGGGLALCYGHYGSLRSKLSGIVVFAPLLELVDKPSWLTVKAGRIAAKILPNHQMMQKLSHTFMSRDEEVCRAFLEDELCHDTGTLLGLAAMLDRGDFLVKKAGEGWDAKIPLLVLHGTGDKVTDWMASKRFAEQLRTRVKGADVDFVELEGWFHKMHAEPGEDRQKFADLVSSWVLKRVGATEEASIEVPASRNVEETVEEQVEEKEVTKPEKLANTEAAPLAKTAELKEMAKL